MKYTAEQTLAILVEGNRKFNAGKIGVQSFQDAQKIMQTDQKPIVVILSCADSRVLPEQIFSQGIGDIFVIRVAGNIATPAQIGSIEYAIKQYDIPLVVVLGHSNCGAISAAINNLRDPHMMFPENLQHIVDDIKPTVIEVYRNHQEAELEALELLAVKENAVNIVSELCADSEFLNARVRSGDLKIIAAKFDMETALVEFFN